ncbi:MAG: hypothetical protein ACE5L7_12425 [Candidatus Aminicenantales bacterium]
MRQPHKGVKRLSKKKPRLTQKEKEILAVVRKNPEGIALPEIAYIMGVAFVTIIQDVNKLLAKGLIKKKGYKYFAC